MAMDAVSLQGVWLTSPVPSDEPAAASTSTAGSGGRVYRYERVPYNSRRDWLRDPRRTPARRAERRDLTEARTDTEGARDPGLAALADDLTRKRVAEAEARRREIEEARRERAKALQQARAWERELEIARERDDEEVLLAVLEAA